MNLKSHKQNFLIELDQVKLLYECQIIKYVGHGVHLIEV